MRQDEDMERNVAYDNEEYRLTPDYVCHRLKRQLTLRQAYGLPGTDGSLKSCLIEYLKNEHSFLSICFAHSASPFTRTDRFLHFYNYISSVVFFNSVFTLANLHFFGDDRPIVIGLLTSVVTIPIKFITRVLLECACCHKGYDYDIQESSSIANCCSCFFKSVQHTFLFLFGTAYILIPFLVFNGVLHRGVISLEWIQSFFYAQAFSFFVVDILVATIVTAASLSKGKKSHEKKWGQYFTANDSGDKGVPGSLTFIAIMAKENYHRDPVLYGTRGLLAQEVAQAETELGNAVKEKSQEIKESAQKQARELVEEKKKSAADYVRKTLGPGAAADKIAGIFAPSEDTDNPLVSGSGVDVSEPEEPLTAANAAAAFQKRWPYYDEWFCINQ